LDRQRSASRQEKEKKLAEPMDSAEKVKKMQIEEVDEE
jgi:hypothetical protein